MAASTQQKLDYLLKKIGYTASKTGLAEDSSLSGTKKAPFAEAIPSPLQIASNSLWADSNYIPSTPPGSDTDYVKVYLSGTSGHRMTVDSTVSGNRAFIPYSTYNDNSSGILGDWIDTQYGDGYIVKVYKGDPNSGGVQLSAAGSGSNDTWFFDYSSGILNFNGTVVPSGVTGTNIYLVGYRYIGAKGATPPGGIGTFSSLVISGVSTFNNTVNLPDNKKIQLGDSGDLQLYHAVSGGGSTSYVDNNTGPLYIRNNVDDDDGGNIIIEAKAGKASAVFQDDEGVRLYYDNAEKIRTTNEGVLVSGGTTTGTLSVTGLSTLDHVNVTGVSTFTGAIDANGDLDVDGHTELDDVNVSGAITATTFTGNLAGTVNTAAQPNITSLGTLTGLDVNGHSELDDVNVSGAITATTFTGNLAGTVNTAAQPNITSLGTLTGLDVNGHSELDDVNVSGVSTFTGAIDANGGADISGGSGLNVTGHTELDDINVSGVATIASAKISDLTSGRVTYAGAGGELQDSSNLTFDGTDITAQSAKVSDLTDNRLVIVGASGALEDSSKATFDGTTFTIDGDATFTGNVTIGGTLTKDDVTNIDSVGVVTAGQGLRATAGGLVVTSGVSTFSDSAYFPDNSKINFGDAASPDLEIYHSGAHSFIKDNGTGDLKIQGGADVVIQSTAGDNSAVFNTDGSVELYYRGTGAGKKLETTGHGAIVTGVLTATTFSGSGASLNSIPNGALDNSTVSYGGISLALGGTDATPAFDLTDATNYPYTSLTGIVTHIVGDTTPELGGNLNGNSKDIYGVGIITATTLDISGNIDVDGHTELDDVNVGGAITATTFTGNLAGTVNTAAQPNITSLGTLTSLDVNGHSELDDVNVGGGVTFGGNVTFNNLLQASGDVNLGSDSADTISVNGRFDTNLVPSSDVTQDLGQASGPTRRWRTLHTNYVNAVGVGTFGSLDISGDIDVDGHTELDDVNVGGAITATTFTGNLAGTVNTAAQPNITSLGTLTSLDVNGHSELDDVNVSGASTFAGNITANGNIVGDSATNISGINSVTATTFYGDGSNLTGIAGTTGTTIFENITVDGNAGIGSLNVTGVSTFAGITTVTGEALYTKQLNVSGLSTFGNTILLEDSHEIFFQDANAQIKRQSDDWLFNLSGAGNHMKLTSNASGGTGGNIYLQPKTAENGIVVNSDSSVDLYNNNLLKFQTTGLGVTVYGTTQTQTLNVTGVSTFAGDAAFHGGVQLGNASSDTINGTGRFSMHLVPGASGSWDLGIADRTWRELHVRSIVQTGAAGVSTFAGDIDVSGNAGIGSLNVTGVSTFTSAVGINSDLTLTNTDPGSAAGPELKLFRNSATPDDADYIGQIKFAGESDTGVERNYAKITGKILDASNTSEDGILEFAHIKAGSQTITGRFRSDSLQLLNGTALSVAGDITANGNIAGDDSTNISGINSVTATSFFGVGSGLTGIANASIASDAAIDGTKISPNFGSQNIVTTGDFNSGSVTITGGTPAITFTDNNNDPDYYIQNNNGALRIYDATNGAERFVVNADGSIALGTGSTIGAVTGVTTYYGDGSGLTNLGIHTTGTTTFETIVVNGNAGIGSLNVTGVSTFGSTVNIDDGVAINFAGGLGSIKRTAVDGFTIESSGSNNVHIEANGGGGTAGDIVLQSAGTTIVQVPGDKSGVIVTGILTATDFSGNISGVGATFTNITGTLQTAAQPNITSVGSLSSLTVTGNVSIGGTLTYEDVTNVDSLGIITARSGIEVSGIVTARAGLAVTYYGDGQFLTGITTAGMQGKWTPDDEENLVAGTQAGAARDADTCFNIMIGACAGKALNEGDDNVFLGRNAGCSNTSGDDNVYIGADVGKSNVAANNVAIGNGAAGKLTGAADNVYIGYQTGEGKFGGTLTGSQNIALGKYALAEITTGGKNVVLGCSAGNKMSTGSDNVALGQLALGAGAVTGSYNVAFGYQSGCAVTSGATHILIGKYAGKGTQTGQDNIFMGKYSGCATSGGSYNVAIGANTMIGTGSKTGNTSLGRFAGCAITAAQYNTFLGYGAGHHTTTGCYNIAIGCAVCLSANSASNELAIGCGTKRWICGDSNFNVGIGTNPADAVGSATTSKLSVGIVSAYQLYGDGQYLTNVGAAATNAWIADADQNLVAGGQSPGANLDGTNACFNNLIGAGVGHCITSGKGNVMLGKWAGYYTKTGEYNTYFNYSGSNREDGDYNVAIGVYALKGSETPADNTGSRNIALGQNAGCRITSGSDNIALGQLAMASGTVTGTSNIAIGMKAGCKITDATGSVYLGAYAGEGSTGGSYNVFFGYMAGRCLTGSTNDNVILGKHAALSFDNGSRNVLIGSCAGAGDDSGAGKLNNVMIGSCAGRLTTGASNNTFIGFGAGMIVTSGDYNTLFGFRAGCNITTGSKNVVIGRDVTVPSATGNCQLAIGDGSNLWLSGNANWNVGIGTTNPDIAVGVGNTAKLSVGIVSAYQLYGDGSNLSGVGFSEDADYNLIAGENAGAAIDPGTTSGCYNVLLGNGAGKCLTDGDVNVLIGCCAGKCLTNGSSNIIFGNRAGQDMTGNAGGNIVLGQYAGLNNGGGTVSDNVYIGDEAGKGASGAISYVNIFIGRCAGYAVDGGNYNTVIGNQAGRKGTDFDHNVLLGPYAGCDITTGKRNIFIGCASGAGGVDITGQRNIAIGNRVNIPSITGNDQLVIGCCSCNWIVGNANFNVGIGTTNPDIAVGVGNTAKLSVGIVSAYQLYGHLEEDENNNIFAGTDAGKCAGTDNSYNVAIGYKAGCKTGTSSSQGYNNVLIGRCAGASNTSGMNNTFLGPYAACANSGGRENVSIGYYSMPYSSGNYNTALGRQAGCKNTGNCNTFIGNLAGKNMTSSCCSVALGLDFEFPSITEDSQLLIASKSIHWIYGNGDGNIGIGTDYPNAAVGVGNTAKLSVGILSAYQLYGDGQYLTNVGGASTDAWAPDSQQNLVAGTGAGAARDADTCFNILIGCTSGAALNEGDHNTFIGGYSGESTTSGGCNIALGYRVFSTNTSGSYNVAIGAEAGKKYAGSDGCNVYIGNRAGCGGSGTVDGVNNIIMGVSAGRTIDGGDNNIFMGCYAAKTVSSGSGNVMLGDEAGCALTTGTDNIGLGHKSMGTGTVTGNCNIALGTQAGGKISSGQYNVFFGKYAGWGNTSGHCNIAIGCNAGKGITDATENISIGGLGLQQAAGNMNVQIGRYGQYYMCGSCNISLGQNTMQGTTTAADNTGTFNLALGHSAMFYQKTGTYNIALGSMTLYGASAGTTGSHNFGGGYKAGYSLTSGGFNVLIGNSAGDGITTGLNNIAIGCGAASKMGVGGENISIGKGAGGRDGTAADNDASNNISIGAGAGRGLTDGDNNIFMGNSTGACTTTGLANVLIGNYAGQCHVSGSENVYISHCAGRCMCNGSANVAVGQQALQGGSTVSANVGQRNVALGKGAGCVITSGCDNVFIGSYTGDAVTSGNENVIIGHGVDVASATGNNQFIIGIDSNKWICGDSSFNTTVNTISASNFNSTSDIRLKTNIQPIGDPIGKVKQIEGVSFNWKKDNKPALGVIADQVEKILPELVHGDDPKTVNYNGLIGLLIETVKEQQTQIETLKDRISKLE